jgi:hypothetical protein
VPCGLSPDQCRRDHVAVRLDDAEADGTDFEAHCPSCGHGGFRVSRPTRSRALRHIWTCACKRCKCSPSEVRAELLRRDISRACLGSYDGNAPKDIQPEIARRQNLAISDILATPHLRPADIRLILAEASGHEVPTETNPFVKFAMAQGIGRRQAYEAAARWCRPSGSHPQTGGGVVDTSRNTDEGKDVKSASSEFPSRAETAQSTCGNRAGTTHLPRAETARHKPAA